MRERGVMRMGGVLAVGGVLVACSGLNTPGREGDLGHGVFEYQCLTDQDPACPEGLQAMAGCSGVTPATPTTTCFPSAIAVGGRFKVMYAPNAATTKVGNPVLKGASPDYIGAFGDGQFKALKPGYVGLYSQSTVDSTVIDYTMIRIDPITRVQLIDIATKKAVPANGVTLARAGAAAYRLSALDANGGTLAGAVEGFVWETSDAKILALVDDPHTATMHVNAVATGTAMLTAYVDDTRTVKAALQVQVQ